MFRDCAEWGKTRERSCTYVLRRNGAPWACPTASRVGDRQQKRNSEAFHGAGSKILEGRATMWSRNKFFPFPALVPGRGTNSVCCAFCWDGPRSVLEDSLPPWKPSSLQQSQDHRKGRRKEDKREGRRKGWGTKSPVIFIENTTAMGQLNLHSFFFNTSNQVTAFKITRLESYCTFYLSVHSRWFFKHLSHC